MEELSSRAIEQLGRLQSNSCISLEDIQLRLVKSNWQSSCVFSVLKHMLWRFWSSSSVHCPPGSSPHGWRGSLHSCNLLLPSIANLYDALLCRGSECKNLDHKIHLEEKSRSCSPCKSSSRSHP